MNLGGASQLLLVDWSNQHGNHRTRRAPRVPCAVLLDPDLVINLGISPSHTFAIPVDNALVGIHLRTQAQILAPAATTQVLDATIGQ